MAEDTAQITEAMDDMGLNEHSDSFATSYYEGNYDEDQDDFYGDDYPMQRVANRMFPHGFPDTAPMNSAATSRAMSDVSTVRRVPHGGSFTYDNASSAETVAPADVQGYPPLGNLAPPTPSAPTAYAMQSYAPSDTATITGTVYNTGSDIVLRNYMYQPPTRTKPGVWVPMDHYYWLKTKLNADGSMGVAWYDDKEEEYAIVGTDLIDTVKLTLRMYDCTVQMNQRLQAAQSSRGRPSRDVNVRTALSAWSEAYRRLLDCRPQYEQLSAIDTLTQDEEKTKSLLVPLVENLYETHQQVIADDEAAFDILWKKYRVRCACDPSANA